MRNEFVRRTDIACIAAALLILSGCGNKLGDEWQFSGTDTKRKIDHYYLKSSVKPVGADGFAVKTKMIPQSGNKAVEESVKIKSAYSVEVTGEIFCPDSAFMVYSKEYFDKQGISLKIEKDGGHMGAVAKIKPGQALHPMVTELCRNRVAPKPPGETGLPAPADKK